MPMGIRIGEIKTDGFVMLILKELFKDICDGYIAPKLISPFHPGDSAHEEIVIFNPSSLVVLDNDDDTQINKYHINEYKNEKDTTVSIKYKNFINMKINIDKSGGSSVLEDKNTFYTDKKYKKMVKEATIRAKKFVKNIKKNIDIKSHIADIHPHIQIYETENIYFPESLKDKLAWNNT
jgi:hypothetical protein